MNSSNLHRARSNPPQFQRIPAKVLNLKYIKRFHNSCSHDTIDENYTSEVENPSIKTSTQLKWRKFRNVYRYLRILMHPQTKIIHNYEEVSMNFSDLPKSSYEQPSVSIQYLQQMDIIKFHAKIRARQDVQLAFKERNLIARLFELVQNGRKGDLDEIQQILDQDSKKYLYPQGHQSRLVNQNNERNENLLYLACRNGFVEQAQLLITNGANPNQLVQKKELLDCCLAVAIRWNHVELVGYLLSHIEFEPGVIQLALRDAKGTQFQREIEKIQKKY